jgi:MFS transporter, VNT family, synaptic vesicle glycoprotein 2
MLALHSFAASILYSTIGLLLPAIAQMTLNQEWNYKLDFLGINYKPWRLFLLVCSLPNLLCVLVLTIFIPESPKFTYMQGDEEKTLKILRKMFVMNTGEAAKNYGVSGIIKNEEFGEGKKEMSQGFVRFIWSQTTPLFQGSHLRNILTACFILFAICNTSNGFWTFFPELINKISLWRQSSNEPATICEIFKNVSIVKNTTDIAAQCVQKLQFDTFVHIYEVGILYVICFAILSLLINKTGKLALILFVTMTTAASAMFLMVLEVPSVLSYLYVYLLLSGLCINIVNASTVELFPTKMRAMAICISMMAGRVGSVLGSVVIGAVIDNHCRETFLMPIVLLLSSGLLAITIPNISKVN